MAFTYDPTTDRGRVRLLLSDTDTVTAANQVFTDAEIDAFLSLGNNDIYASAAAGARALAANASKSGIAWRALNESIDKKELPKHFLALAQSFDEQSERAPAEEIDSFDYGVNRYGQRTGESVGDDLL